MTTKEQTDKELLEEKKGYFICGRTIKNGENKGKPCGRKAGWGTNRVGEQGVGCKHHDGKSVGEVRTTGKYSKRFSNTRIKAIMEEMEENPHPTDLTDELALLRGKLALIIENLDKFPEIISKFVRDEQFSLDEAITWRQAIPTITSSRLEESIAKIAKTEHEIKVGMKMVIEVPQIEDFMIRVSREIGNHVKDKTTRRAIARGIESIPLLTDTK